MAWSAGVRDRVSNVMDVGRTKTAIDAGGCYVRTGNNVAELLLIPVILDPPASLICRSKRLSAIPIIDSSTVLVSKPL